MVEVESSAASAFEIAGGDGPASRGPDEPGTSASSPEDKEYRLELYKSLRKEAAGYVEKVPGLWLQKFLLTGGVTGFLIAKHAEIGGVRDGDVIVNAAVILVPILAVLLDAKIAEYGLHARTISYFLADKYRSPALLAEWEACMWGDEPLTLPARMARLRSALTVVVTVVPTAALMCLAGIVVAQITTKWTLCIGVAGGLALSYLVAGGVGWSRLWPRKCAKPSDDADAAGKAWPLS